MNTIDRAHAHRAFGKAHRIGKCSKCDTLYVWPRRDMIGLSDTESPTPCCAAPLCLTTWGKRSAVVLTRMSGTSLAIDLAYQR